MVDNLWRWCLINLLPYAAWVRGVVERCVFLLKCSVDPGRTDGFYIFVLATHVFGHHGDACCLIHLAGGASANLGWRRDSVGMTVTWWLLLNPGRCGNGCVLLRLAWLLENRERTGLNMNRRCILVSGLLAAGG